MSSVHKISTRVDHVLQYDIMIRFISGVDMFSWDNFLIARGRSCKTIKKPFYYCYQAQLIFYLPATKAFITPSFPHNVKSPYRDFAFETCAPSEVVYLSTYCFTSARLKRRRRRLLEYKHASFIGP